MKLYISIVLLLISTITIAQNDSIQNKYTKKQLLEDYDLMVSSLKEAHPGLYWYTSYSEYEKIFKENRNKIYDGMNSYEFFKILSFVTAADKEGHSSVRSSNDIGKYIREKAKFLPFSIKTINKELYITNNIGPFKTKGKILQSINEVPIDFILEKIFSHTSRLSDGFTTTGKYKSLDRFGFIWYYLDYIQDSERDSVDLSLLDNKTGQKSEITISLVNRDSLREITKSIPRKKIEQVEDLFSFEIKPNIKTGILTFNSFSYRAFKNKKLTFKTIVDSLFLAIEMKKIKNLIIDIRNNGGGTEGAEDYLFSYLTEASYKKYEYVEVKGFEYSFIENTNYKDNKENLYEMLNDEHYRSKDGRYLRKFNVLPTHPPRTNAFQGNLFILISGNTYSGGSEFASIAKSHSNASFIGEETGGGFYGQTSGSYLSLLLPNSKMKIRIPLLKFMTTFKSKNIPFGRGVIPDYNVAPTFEEYNIDKDIEMEFTLSLITDKNKEITTKN